MLSLEAAARDPEMARRIALETATAELTYAELAARSARLRGGLAAKGVVAGSRVAVRARNDVATVALIHALIDLGAVLVPIHPRLTALEADEIVADVVPRLRVEDADLPELEASTSASPEPKATNPRAPLAILYTSGTTGKAKGAVLSRAAFLASAAASEANLGWRSDDRWLLCLPLCHIGGLSIITRCLLARRPVVLAERFEPAKVLDLVVRRHATLLSVVPTMLDALLEADGEGVLRRLRAVLVGGAATPLSLLQGCEARGVVALATYGLTEACSQVTTQELAHPYRATAGSGRPLGGTEVEIAGGGVGAIRVRGPTLMDGYFQGPGAPPRSVTDAEGWLDTGDIGEIDGAGALHVHARRVDLIVTGGENVYPVEVEQRLMTIPGVRDALVFGVPDPRWGQIIACALVLAPSTSLEVALGLASERLAPHKRPRLACAVDELPRTSTGKAVRVGAHERYAPALHSFAPGKQVR